MDLQLKDKIAFVAGASRGLGFAAAHLLAQEGARVVINSRNASSLAKARQKIEKETGAEVLDLPGDLADPEVPARLIERAASSLGGLDILMTNAGGPPSGSFESFTDEDWQKAINLSFMSHVRLIHAALPYLRRSKSPSVLTFTSYSVRQPIPNLILSNSIRLATIGLTKTLALEMGHEGIRFNSILPGWTETEHVNEIMDVRSEKSGLSREEEIQKQTKESALGRIGTPIEIARAAVFLASPAASFITSVMLTVDGGTVKATL